MAENGQVLRLDGVCKSYNVGTPIEVEVLHGVSLTLDRGGAPVTLNVSPGAVYSAR